MSGAELKPGDLCVIAGACCPAAREIAVDLQCTVVGPAEGRTTICVYCDERTRESLWCDVHLGAGGDQRAVIPRQWLRKLPPDGERQTTPREEEVLG